MNACQLITKSKIVTDILNKCILNKDYLSKNSIINLMSKNGIIDKDTLLEILSILNSNDQLVDKIELFEETENEIKTIWATRKPSKPADIQFKDVLDINVSDINNFLSYFNNTQIDKKRISKLNKIIYDRIRSTIIGSTFFNREKKEIVDSSNLVLAIQTLLTKCMKTIYSKLYPNQKISISDTTFSWNMDKARYIKYKDVLHLALSNIITEEGDVDIELLQAVITITNLDDLINHFSPTVKTNNMVELGSLHISNDKYIYKTSQIKSNIFNDDSANSDAERIADINLRSVIESIPREKPIGVNLDPISISYDHDDFIDWQFFQSLLREGKTAMKRIENIDTLFETYKGKNQLSLNSLRNYIKDYQEAFEKRFGKVAFVNEGEFEQKYNLIHKIIHAFNELELNTLTEVTDKEIKSLNKQEIKERKFPIRDRIISTVKANIINGFSDRLYYNGLEGVDLTQLNATDPKILILLDKLTGLALSEGVAYELFQGENQSLPGRFLTRVGKLVQRCNLLNLQHNELNAALKTFEDFLVLSEEYVQFSDIFAQLNPVNKTTMLNAQGDDVPSMMIHSTMGAFFELKKEKESILANNNILYAENTETDLCPIEVIGSIFNMTNPYRYLKATELSVAECALLEIGKFYYNNSVKKYDSEIIARFQIDAYSDKGRIFVGKQNIAALLRKDKNELQKIYYKQQENYYRQLLKDFINKFSNIYGKKHNENQNLLDQYLSYFTDSLTEEDLLNRASAGNPLVQDKYYCIYTDENKQRLVRPNPRFAYYLKSIENFENFQTHLNETSELFYDEVKNMNLEIDFEEAIEPMWLFDNESNVKKSFLNKYFLIRNLVRDAYLQVTILPSFFHDNKGGLLTASEINNAFNGDKELYLKIQKNISDTAIAGKKRGNVAGASYVRGLVGTKFGQQEYIRCATLDEPVEEIFNFLGDSMKLSVHDGLMMTVPLAQHWETRSYPTVTPKGHVRKSIVLDTQFGHVHQIKAADYCITNEMIRNAGRNTNHTSTYRNLRTLIKKSYSLARLEDFKNALKNNKKPINFELYNYINGKLAKLTNISINDNNTINLNWTYVEDNTAVLSEELKTLFSSDGKVNEDGTFNLDNLFDLWEAFGSETAQSIVDGELKFSEYNNELLADMISSLNVQHIKKDIVSKYVNPSAIKSGKTNMNSADRVYGDKELLTYKIDTLKYGMLQDYTHESNESESPFPTLVLSALAFHGHNIEKCNEIYKAVGLIIENSLLKLPIKTNITKSNKWLGKKLMHAFKHSPMSTSAAIIVEKFIKGLSEQGEIKLPVSDPDLYYKLTSDILSSMNNSSIRQKLPGAGLIQNPSRGIALIYEDNLGKKYTRTDLYEEGVKLGYLGNFDAIVAQVLTWPNFENISVTSISLLNIQDHVIINGEKEHITTPKRLLEIANLLEEGNEIIKIYTEPRDLATTKITWKVEGKGYNYWTLWSTVKLHNALFDKNSEEYKEAVKLDEKQRAALQNGKMIDLDENGNYIERDITDYSYKAGELIAPRQYKNRLALNKSLVNISKDHFIDVIKKRFSKTTNIPGYCICQTSSDFTTVENNKEFYFNQEFENTNENPWQSNVVIKEGNVYTINGEFLLTLPEGETPEIRVSIKNDKTIVEIKTIDLDLYLPQFDPNRCIYYYPNNEIDFDETILLNKYKTPEEAIRNYAGKMYNSFVLSNLTLSLRIPSLSFLSFMASETVAYTESDENNVYNNIWEMVFQGSDFDIDKAYTVMFNVNDAGLIAGNPFTKYNSIESIRESLRLPVPTGKKIEYNENADNTVDKIISNILTINKIPHKDKNGKLSFENFNNLINSDIKKYYKVLNHIITKLNSEEYDYSKKNRSYSLIKKINRHNGFKEYKTKHKGIILKRIDISNDYLQNVIVNGMIDISSDLNNLVYSSTFMDAKSMTLHIDKEPRLESELNPLFVWRTQQENAVGKTDVGIAANGLKVASTLQLYYNTEFLKGNISDLNIKVNLSYDDTQIDTTIHHIANLNLTDLAIVTLYGPDVDINAKREELNNQESAADNLSIILSLAVDNAKELALASMYGYPDLLKFHVALATLGFTKKEIVKLSLKYLKPICNIIINQNNRLIKNSSYQKINITNTIDSIETFSEEEKNSLKNIFSFADLMTSLAQLLKINQGVSPSYYEFSDFVTKFIDSTNLTINQIAEIIETKSIDGIYSDDHIGIKPLEVIVNHPVFYGLLKAIIEHKQLLNLISSKTHLYDSLKSKLDRKVSKNTNIIKLIDDYVLGLTLKQMNILIPAELFKNLFNVELGNAVLDYGVIELSTNIGIRRFIDYMNQYIIPEIKKYFPDNYFLSNLNLSKNGNFNLPWSVIDTSTNDVLKLNLTFAKNEFEKIAELKSGLTTMGLDLTVGDLLYVYNLITTKDSMNSSLKYCTKEHATTGLNLAQYSLKAYEDLDNLPQNSNDPNIESLESLSNKLIYYYYLANTEVSSLEIESGNTIALTRDDGYITTFTPINFSPKEEFKQTLKNLINLKDFDIIEDPNVSDDFIELTYQLQGHSFHIKVRNHLSTLKHISDADLKNLYYSITPQLLTFEKLTKKYNLLPEQSIDTVIKEINKLKNQTVKYNFSNFKDLVEKNLQNVKIYIATTLDHSLPIYHKINGKEYLICSLNPDDLVKGALLKESGVYTSVELMLWYFKKMTNDTTINLSNYIEKFKEYTPLLVNEDKEFLLNLITLVENDDVFFKTKAYEIIDTYLNHLRFLNLYYIPTNEDLKPGYIIKDTHLYIGESVNKDGGIDYIGLNLKNDTFKKFSEEDIKSLKKSKPLFFNLLHQLVNYFSENDFIMSIDKTLAKRGDLLITKAGEIGLIINKIILDKDNIYYVLLKKDGSIILYKSQSDDEVKSKESVFIDTSNSEKIESSELLKHNLLKQKSFSVDYEGEKYLIIKIEEDSCVLQNKEKRISVSKSDIKKTEITQNELEKLDPNFIWFNRSKLNLEKDYSHVIEQKEKDGDIYISKNGTIICKRLEEGFYLIKTLNKRNRWIYSITDKKPNEASEHYSKKVEAFTEKAKESSQIANNETINKFVEEFQLVTGIPIHIVGQPQNSNIKASVTENGVTIYIPLNIGEIENVINYIFKESTHEFTHVLLAYLKKHSADKYIDLLLLNLEYLKRTKTELSEDLKNYIENSLYLSNLFIQKESIDLETFVNSSNFEQLEEIFVRALTEKATNALNINKETSWNSMIISFNCLFTDIFGGSFNLLDTIGQNLSRSRFSIKDLIGFNSLQNEVISWKILDYIEYKCEN